ncbi:MAG: type VII secretion protein EssC [Bacilli bacterium]|nr:type VII secretion protein EssC [Bacilli bacterium]
MKISLYLFDRVVDFRLPNDVSGSFSFDADDVESKLINVEARDSKWVLYDTGDVNIVYNDTFVSSIPLVTNNFYVLKRDNENYLIYVTDVVSSNLLTYTFDNSLNLIIGRNEQANIRYNCIYLQNYLISVSFKNNSLVLENPGGLVLYVNKHAITNNAIVIRCGDELEVYGLKIMFLNGLVLINNISDRLFINPASANINSYAFSPQGQTGDFEIKDVDLYKKEDYFSKSPRIRRVIETKKIKLSAPPRDGESQELPLILVIGPMMTMGVMSGSMVLNTITKITSGQASMADSWPQLVTSGVMLVSMIVWPLVTQAYNRMMKKQQRKEIIRKYTEYINEKRAELLNEAKQQSVILFENLITIPECLNIIEHRNINFWDKRTDQSDFLVVRIGVGNELLDAKIDYPEEGFTIEENELKQQADLLIDEFKYLKNVPIAYSFYDNRTTALMGPDYKTLNFMNNIIVQLITFYSYEDLKIVVFTSDERREHWSYLRYLNHTFNNERSFRFFASDTDSAKILAEYLGVEVGSRFNQVQGNNVPSFKPYYLVIIDDYDMVKRYDFVKTITESESNLGFSLVIIENRLSNLPSKCNNFITIGEKLSGVLKNSYENQEQLTFFDEIKYNIDMMGIAKILSNIPIEFEEGMRQLPDAVTFLEMEKVGKVEQLNILNRWNTNDSTTSLRAEVGVDDQGDLMYLDLHEKYHGPHGLVAGMTGSGKSEFIITYILSMAINYSPDDISFILIDYKGGGLAFAFENKSTGVVLPHLSGTITNLDKAEMDRTLVSIDSEIKRRQHVFNEARDMLGESTIDIYKYQRFYKDGKLSEAVPHLFIICDEFAELKTQQPDFMDNLISVARIGRSLGVHLILATQKPSGVVNDQIWSNTKFRVCLKVQDESDSREMLKRPEAASLKQVGRFYLQVGYDEYFALGQSGYCGAKYYPSEKIVKQVDKSINFIDDCGRFIKSIQASNGIKIKPQGEQLAAIMSSIISVAERVGKRARKLWLDNIPDIIVESNLEDKYGVLKDDTITAIVGEYDAPEKQEQGLVKYDFLGDGNTIIYGTDGSEREMLLNTIIYSSCKNYDVNSLNYYMIDYGSESLRRYINLPHVGGVVFASEDEKYNNLLKLIKQELQHRKRLFADYGGEYLNYIKNSSDKLPLIVIILNNYDSIYESNPDIYEELPDLIRDSERYGIVFIITGSSMSSVQNKISQNCRNIYVFKQKDASDYTSIFGVRTKVIPREIAGRGLLNNDGIHEFQTASIVSNPDELNDYLINFIKEQKTRNLNCAKKIPVLPDIVRLENVIDKVDGLKRVAVGISKKELEVLTVDYLSNLGNIVSSNKLLNTEIFIKSLLIEFLNIKDLKVLVFDPMKLLNLKKDGIIKYYDDNMEENLNLVIDYLHELIDSKSDTRCVVVIYGINKFVGKLTDNNKMSEFTKLVKEYENMSVIIADDASKIKSFNFETWFTTIFNINDGVWIGRGVSDQNLLHLSNVTREMTKDYKNDMGYLVSESVGTLMKLIDFVSSYDGGADEK